MRTAARRSCLALHSSEAAGRCRAATIASASDSAGGPRRSRPALQRQPHGERPLSHTAAAAATTAAPAAESWASVPAHRALQVLSRYRALVLDSAYRPVEVVNWQRAICMDLLQKADVLEYYEATVSSVSEQFFLPAVMRTRRYHPTSRHARVALNRRNILLRDKLCCQYCGKSKEAQLTIDHVMPASKGGGNTWENLVTACAPCNSKKGDKTLKQLKWKLLAPPREPSPYELNIQVAAIGADKADVPSEWTNYLFGSLEDRL